MVSKRSSGSGWSPWRNTELSRGGTLGDATASPASVVGGSPVRASNSATQNAYWSLAGVEA